jgi:hypothetical protein
LCYKIKSLEPNKMAHAYGHSYLGGLDPEDHSLRPSRQKFSEALSQQMSQVKHLRMSTSSVKTPVPRKNK